MPDQTILRQCAWCGHYLTAESKPIPLALPLDAAPNTTHGICVDCQAEWLSEYAQRRQPKASAA